MKYFIKCLAVSLIVCMLFLTTSCQQIQRRRAGKWYSATNEKWVSDDGNIILYPDGDNRMGAEFNFSGTNIICFAHAHSWLEIAFTTIEIPNTGAIDSSEYYIFTHRKDYTLLEGTYNFSTNQKKGFTLTIDLDQMEKFGYETMYEKGHEITFTKVEDDSN